MMTQRENYFAMVEGGEPEFTPVFAEFQNMCVGVSVAVDGFLRPGLDMFGRNWVANSTGAMPEPNNFLFDDVADWEDYVQIPDINSIPVEQIYEQEKATLDDTKVTVLHQGGGAFERMVSFMGFENTLVGLLSDPEASKAFVDALVDFRLKLTERMLDVYKPDLMIIYDDVAAAKDLFMSPDTWRELFKPGMRAIGELVESKGALYGYHVCGKVDSIVDDMVEIGVRHWNSAQCMNDLAGIMERHGNRLIVDGGWDSACPASHLQATTEQVLGEGRRCLDEYAKYDSFMLYPVLINERGNAVMVGDERLDALLDMWHAEAVHNR